MPVAGDATERPDEDAHLGLTDRKGPPPLPVEGSQQAVDAAVVAAQVAQPRADDYRRADASSRTCRTSCARSRRSATR